MMKSSKRIVSVLLVLLAVALLSTAAFADGETAVDTVVEAASEHKALGAAIAIGLVGAAGAVGMGMVVANAVKGTARQPEASGKIQTVMMLGLVFLETAIIYALIIALLILFVL